MNSYISPETRVPQDHPLRAIRGLVASSSIPDRGRGARLVLSRLSTSPQHGIASAEDGQTLPWLPRRASWAERDGDISSAPAPRCQWTKPGTQEVLAGLLGPGALPFGSS